MHRATTRRVLPRPVDGKPIGRIGETDFRAPLSVLGVKPCRARPGYLPARTRQLPPKAWGRNAEIPMSKRETGKSTKRRAATAAAALAAAVAGTMVATQPASAAPVTPSHIISKPHTVQNACAQRILAAQGPSAWTGWNGSLDDMRAESGNSDTAVNSSSGAAGYYQIMPSTWADLCGDL